MQPDVKMKLKQLLICKPLISVPDFMKSTTSLKIIPNLFDLKVTIPHIEAPIIIVQGNNDSFCLLEVIEELLPTFKNVQFIIVPFANHGLRLLHCIEHAFPYLTSFSGTMTQ